MWKVYITQQNIKAQILMINKAQSGKAYGAFQKHVNSEVQSNKHTQNGS